VPASAPRAVRIDIEGSWIDRDRDIVLDVEIEISRYRYK